VLPLFKEKNMANQTIEQNRSRMAYEKVKTVSEKDVNIQKKYKSRAKDFPAMVMTNGLLQALSFVMSKKDDEGCKWLSGHISNWIKYAITEGWIQEPGNAYTADNIAGLIEWLSSEEIDVSSYVAVTNEVLSFTPWLKRFAEGMLEGE
jgi:CRISPR type III-B/RAMP module-associated protein Cmr5